MTTETSYVTEIWTAMGTRITSDGKRRQAFRDPEGRVHYWGDRTSHVVGGRYEMQVRREGNATYRLGRPAYVDRLGEYPEEWEIASEAAERRLRREAAERRDKRQPGRIDEACRPLCELAATIGSYEDIERLLISVRRRVVDAWDKKQA